MLCVQVPGDAEAALHRLQTKLLDVPAGAKRASREVSSALLICPETPTRHGLLWEADDDGICKLQALHRV